MQEVLLLIASTVLVGTNLFFIVHSINQHKKINILRDRGDLYKQLYKRFHELYHIQKTAISVLSSHVKSVQTDAYVSDSIYLSQETEDKIRVYERIK